MIYATPPMVIGKSEWRCVVEERSNCNVTLYEWRKPGSWWKSQRDWPRYDFNDTYLGLPKTLAKLYDKYRNEIDRALSMKGAAA